MSRTVAARQITLRQRQPAGFTVPPDWTLRRRQGVTVLQARALNRIPWLVHGFSTRLGGASRQDGRAALNLGYVDWDERGRVDENRRLLTQAVNGSSMQLVALRQFHSSMVRVLEHAPAAQLRGDALVTRAPGLLLAVQTADCVPILMVDPRTRAVAAIHAGWRGTLARIVEKTVGNLQMHFGSRPRDLIAAIGPAIGDCCYEVGPDVAQAFAGQFPEAGEWFDGPFGALSTGEEPTPFLWLQNDPPGHARPKLVLLNLAEANRWQLANAGLRPERISACGLCTYCQRDWFFSYRREGQRSGRQMNVVGRRR